jgi:hypothetical protein
MSTKFRYYLQGDWARRIQAFDLLEFPGSEWRPIRTLSAILEYYPRRRKSAFYIYIYIIYIYSTIYMDFTTNSRTLIFCLESLIFSVRKLDY